MSYRKKKKFVALKDIAEVYREKDFLDCLEDFFFQISSLKQHFLI